MHLAISLIILSKSRTITALLIVRTMCFYHAAWAAPNAETGNAALLIGSIPLTRMYLKADWTNDNQRTALVHKSRELLTLE